MPRSNVIAKPLILLLIVIKMLRSDESWAILRARTGFEDRELKGLLRVTFILSCTLHLIFSSDVMASSVSMASSWCRWGFIRLHRDAKGGKSSIELTEVESKEIERFLQTAVSRHLKTLDGALRSMGLKLGKANRIGLPIVQAPLGEGKVGGAFEDAIAGYGILVKVGIFSGHGDFRDRTEELEQQIDSINERLSRPSKWRWRGFHPYYVFVDLSHGVVIGLRDVTTGRAVAAAPVDGTEAISPQTNDWILRKLLKIKP